MLPLAASCGGGLVQGGGVMVPTKISHHLQQAGIPFQVRRHRRAVTAQELAASVHMSGYRVAKAVLIEVDGKRMMAVLPATRVIDVERLGNAMGALAVRMMEEGEFAALFSDSDVGAEPPFGSLYGLPVLLDRSLAHAGPLILRGGSHEEALELQFEDFARLERPRLEDFTTLAPSTPHFRDRLDWRDENDDWM
jgi:Ala-tRNA(Pro) deacylase